jgi:serine/threonine protein kinase
LIDVEETSEKEHRTIPLLSDDTGCDAKGDTSQKDAFIRSSCFARFSRRTNVISLIIDAVLASPLPKRSDKRRPMSSLDDLTSDPGFGATVRQFTARQRLFDRYVLKEILGRGGMGIVWLAVDEQLERDVALKFLPEMVAFDEQAVSDLKRETKKSQELRHHHIVQVYDFVSDKQNACIAMEYVDGSALSAIKARQLQRCFEVDEIRDWVEQLCEALAYAHGRARVVHRDLKPANLMVNSKGELKITDFGIARSLSDAATMITGTQRTSGTLVYMSPQQLDGEKASHLDDIYSLGATLYELLTSKPPFYTGQIDRQIHEKVPMTIALRRPELGIMGGVIPQNWEGTIASCLAKEPARRPQSATEVAEQLRQRPAAVAVTPAPLAPPPPLPPPAPLPPLAPQPLVNRGPRVAPSPLFLVAAAAALLLIGVTAVVTWHFIYYLPEQRRQDADQAARSAESLRAEHPAKVRGSLLVNTEPAGAEVTLGEQTQKSPTLFANLSIGPSHLKISLDGYQPLERDVDIKENEISNPGVLRLQRSIGSARIDSQPESLEFELIDADGGRRTGTTPALLANIPTGMAHVMYKPSGTASHTEQLTIDSRSTATLTWRVPEQRLHTVSDYVTTAPSPPATDWQLNSSATSAPAATLGEYTYKGMVGPYEAAFRLKFELGERVSGSYTMPVNKGLVLRLEGRNPKGKLFLDEYTRERLSAHIELTLNSSGNEIRWEGTMYNTPPDNRVFPVSFTRSR